ncbi:cytochrome P450 monooxygenase radP [Colletotrichum spaethianum]|uniref:Cytochrome P450 monooxygenase radP n=1 Tax=Colletotrichum spaethianum TaxID=700344 RepID=A0AA37L691_9PEZI|nr:cytochrome P450 monooxygenase radP [Colletotrichum spaethianum]GKT42643.1 cytochrome P450 monooxygenase radP [Colletotrichum spaethianum]
MALSYGILTLYLVELTFVYYFLLGIYNVFFHPLRHYPGPIFWRFSPVPKNLYLLMGNYATKAREIHETYPGTAWKDIMGRPLKSEMPKDLRFFGGENFGRDSIVTARPEDHTRQRRIFTPSFSNTALKAQQPLLAGYADQMVEAMDLINRRDGSINIVDLYNFCAFDIMADLTFGEPLLLLKKGGYIPWVHNLFAGLKFVIWGLVFLEIPVLGPLVQAVTAAPLKKKAKGHTDFAGHLVDRRLKKENHTKPDIWSFVLRHSGDEAKGLSGREMHANAAMFMAAGTETTATVLSGTTFYLLRTPRVYDLLTKEIRDKFAKAEDICVDGLVGLEYLQATLVSVNPYVAFTHPDNWARPTEFVPERWLHPEAPEWKDDKRDVHEPFSYGPRNCIGKNLAWLELRLLLAKTLWHYDLEMCPGMENWVAQKCYLTWEKGPLMVKLMPVKRG